MTTDGGGWTRVNTSLATVTGNNLSVLENDTFQAQNVYADCKSVPASLTATNVKIPFTNYKIYFTRTTTILQCYDVPLTDIVTSKSYYLDAHAGNIIAENGTCKWDDNIWAKEQSNVSADGLKLYWKKFFTTSSVNTGFKITSTCTNSQDTGMYKAQIYIK